MATKKKLTDLSAAERKKELAKIRRHITKIRASYTWEQKMESRLLQLYFILEEFYEEWRIEMKKRKANDRSKV